MNIISVRLKKLGILLDTENHYDCKLCSIHTQILNDTYLFGLTKAILNSMSEEVDRDAYN